MNDDESSPAPNPRKILFVNADLCTGCRLCELACAEARENLSGPGMSRIRVETWSEVNASVPVVCVHCTRAPCLPVCPTGARTREADTGRILIHAPSCIACGQCRTACPFDVPRLHPVEGHMMGCDLCNFEPACVPVCTTGALRFVHPSRGARLRRRDWALGHFEKVR